MAYDEGLAGRVGAVLPRGGAVTEREVFGGLAFMLGGRMFCGIVKDALMARLGPEAAGRARGQPDVRLMDFTGRLMTGMVFIDPAGLRGDALRRRVGAAAGYARGRAALAPGAGRPRAGDPCGAPGRRPVLTVGGRPGGATGAGRPGAAAGTPAGDQA